MPKITIEIIDIIVLFGAGQGLILAFILVSTKRLRKMSNFFLAILLFTLALLTFTNTFETNYYRDIFPDFQYIPSFWLTLIPTSVYFYIKYLINPDYKWKKTDWLFLIPFVIEFAHRVYRYIYYKTVRPYTHEENLQFYFETNIYESIAVIASFAVVVYAIKELKKYEDRLYEIYSEVEDKSLKWLRTCLIFGFALIALWGVLTILDFDYREYQQYLEKTLLLGLSILMYYIGYSMIIRQGLLDTSIFAIANDSLENQMPDQNNGKELSQKTDEHYRKLKALLEQENLYRDPSLNMSMLSDKTGLSNGYLSQIINQKHKLNFFDFVNSYRVEDVKDKMSDPAYGHYTLLGLAQEAGFKSKSTFNSVFKKMTGKTPSAYRKSL